MLVGYNNNITYKGKVYHVQTEDSGLKNPVIVTLLYFKGTILASKKTDYSRLIGSPDINKQVRELMKEQQKAMMKELIAGKHTGEVKEETDEGKAAIEIAAGVEASGTAVKSDADKTLDDILLDYIMQKGKGK
ncbi:MAG: hypothetical protein HY754_12105 [Nitrospirae bacterium]|nr:hypothetical protein [Nitrospirota bacterium]